MSSIPKDDPVTGVAHCVLAPFWAHKLNKNKLSAYQLSKRGGEVICEFTGERVYLNGKAVLYLIGALNLSS